MQFWRHFLWRVPKPDNSYGGVEKKTGNLGGRWILCIDDASQHWKYRGGCNSMQWRFFLDHLPRHLHWKHLIQTDSILGSSTLYFDQSFMSLLFCCFFLHEFNLIIYNKQVWFSIFWIWCCSKTVSIVCQMRQMCQCKGGDLIIFHW